jgi:hypothetical protein
VEIEGNLVEFTIVSVYLEDAAVLTFSIKWPRKIPNKLTADVAFFRDIYMGELEKSMRATFIYQPLNDEVESLVKYLKPSDTYLDIKAMAVEEFKAAFKTWSLHHWTRMAEQLEEGDLVVCPGDHLSGFNPLVNNRQCCNFMQLQILLQYIAI